MKEEISVVEEIKKEKTPVLSLSVTDLDIEVEEGKVYRGSFFIESENNIPMNGYVCSTSDKLAVETEKLEGLRQEIPYYFKGKLAMAGNEFTGEIVLITNGGEYTIPCHILVTNKSVETSDGRISTMEEFVRLYEKNRKEAVELFFLPNFEEVFLKGAPEKQALYHNLMKSRSRRLILEEFLTAAGYKEPAELTLLTRKVVLEKDSHFQEIMLSLSRSGYLEGTISCQKGQLMISCSHFTSDDFSDGKFLFRVEKNPNMITGSDVLVIDTVRQHLEIPVEWWGKQSGMSRERENRLWIKKKKAELMHNYLYFRTGSIGFEDFSGDSGTSLDELFHITGDAEWKLYKLHILLMEEQEEKAQAALNVLAKMEEEGKFTPLEKEYFLYLKALYYRTPEAISRAVSEIREFYAVSPYKAEALWMLIYLDREYVYNKRLQYDTIRQLFEEGNNSSLLYFEACDILNDNPNYMEELGKFEISIFRWGVRYGYISLALSYQFARLALKMKYFNKSVYYIAEKLYGVEPDERFLQVICSLLIKGNRTGKEYHEYFRLAVEANLKIIGLNEFFIRSMDFSRYEVIPQRVLIYFTYSNSLDYLEKAYLYTNVLKNKEQYEEVYGAYYSKMLPFVEEQLLKGRINEHLACLYTFFQKEVLEKPDNWKAVCDVLFYRKLICKNPHMIGVYIVCPETGEEKYYPLVGGTSCVEVYNDQAVLYFVDNSEQRYITGIEYELQEFLSPEQFAPEWIRRNLGNKKILLMESGKIKEVVKEDMLPVLQRIVFNEDFTYEMRQQFMEKLLMYYESHQLKRELSHWLEKIDYSSTSPDFKKTLMDYYMEVGMMENAFFGAELFGSEFMGAAKRLRLASFGVQYYQGKKDEVTLSLAYAAFCRKKYNKDTLTYLMEYFRGETKTLVQIWEKGKRFALDTSRFERRILRQVMFTDNDTDGVFPVFESFYETMEGDSLIDEYLEYASMKELENSMEMNDFMHMVIGKEIETGRMKNRDSRIHFLYYFSQRQEWFDRIKDTAAYIISGFLQEEFYLPVYHAYESCVHLPIVYRELTFLTYKGKAGSNVRFTYQIDGEEDYVRTLIPEEVLPGMYVCHMNFFQKDHVKYRLEADGEPVEEKDALKFETFGYEEGEESRFFTLNRLDSEEVSEKDFEKYLLQAYFADRYMKLL
ncbi:MAG: DUF5717 family protein [Eubacterium sp.]|nr:DUF5717 family protein [Eubacterium sp.]